MTWPQIWATWLGVVLGSFGVLEGLGLGVHLKTRGAPPNESLSEVTWHFLKVVPGEPFYHWSLPHVLAAVAVLALVLVLAGHLILGLWH